MLLQLRQLYKGNIVVKDGVNGSFIYTDEDKLIDVLSYEAAPICPVGAGDCFNVVYLSELMNGADIQTSLDMASYVSAKIIEHEFPAPSFLERDKNIQEWKSGQRKRKDRLSPRIYLAAPFFSDSELHWVEFICAQLEQEQFQVFSPSRDAGIINEYTSMGERKEVFLRDISEIENCDIVVALTDNDDQGTLWEIGYAYALGKPVYCLQTSIIKGVNNMLSHSSVVVRNVKQLQRVLRNNMGRSVWT
ncbi:PfkB family carbohydrate kinase [Aneurinibacillus tyrosinisolvens]|uniref:PfkB family carbohydrate kinase n=1 Tax=Aneurinibacillus tyrosinisolvens TaxID=1443435 RepID=UPI000699BDBB|nr:PfkB family carbohydrate kinase [Aneurinibacillus tyrosinisolvens]